MNSIVKIWLSGYIDFPFKGNMENLGYTYPFTSSEATDIVNQHPEAIYDINNKPMTFQVDPALVKIDGFDAIEYEVDPGEPTYPTSVEGSIELHNWAWSDSKGWFHPFAYETLRSLGRPKSIGGHNSYLNDLFILIESDYPRNEIYKGKINNISYDKRKWNITLSFEDIFRYLKKREYYFLESVDHGSVQIDNVFNSGEESSIYASGDVGGTYFLSNNNIALSGECIRTKSHVYDFLRDQNGFIATGFWDESNNETHFKFYRNRISFDVDDIVLYAYVENYLREDDLIWHCKYDNIWDGNEIFNYYDVELNDLISVSGSYDDLKNQVLSYFKSTLDDQRIYDSTIGEYFHNNFFYLFVNFAITFMWLSDGQASDFSDRFDEPGDNDTIKSPHISRFLSDDFPARTEWVQMDEITMLTTVKGNAEYRFHKTASYDLSSYPSANAACIMSLHSIGLDVFHLKWDDEYDDPFKGEYGEKRALRQLGTFQSLGRSSDLSNADYTSDDKPNLTIHHQNESWNRAIFDGKYRYRGYTIDINKDVEALYTDQNNYVWVGGFLWKHNGFVAGLDGLYMEWVIVNGNRYGNPLTFFDNFLTVIEKADEIINEEFAYTTYYNNFNLLISDYEDINSLSYISDIQKYGWVGNKINDILVNLSRQIFCYCIVYPDGKMAFKQRKGHEFYFSNSFDMPDTIYIPRDRYSIESDDEYEFNIPAYSAEWADVISVANVESDETIRRFFDELGNVYKSRPTARSIQDIKVSNYRTDNLAVPDARTRAIYQESENDLLPFLRPGIEDATFPMNRDRVIPYPMDQVTNWINSIRRPERRTSIDVYIYPSENSSNDPLYDYSDGVITDHNGDDIYWPIKPISHIAPADYVKLVNEDGDDEYYIVTTISYNPSEWADSSPCIKMELSYIGTIYEKIEVVDTINDMTDSSSVSDEEPNCAIWDLSENNITDHLGNPVYEVPYVCDDYDIIESIDNISITDDISVLKPDIDYSIDDHSGNDITDHSSNIVEEPH